MGSCRHFLLPALLCSWCSVSLPCSSRACFFSLQLYHFGLMSIGLFPRQHLIPSLDEFVFQPVLFLQSFSVRLFVSCALMPVRGSSWVLCVPDLFLMVFYYCPWFLYYCGISLAAGPFVTFDFALWLSELKLTSQSFTCQPPCVSYVWIHFLH